MKSQWVAILAIGALGAKCTPEEQHLVCSNAVSMCPVEVCESLPLLPCDLVDQTDVDWPCPCVGPGLISIEQPIPGGPPNG